MKRHDHGSFSIRVMVLAALALAAPACKSPPTREELLEDVAKDWCLTIRASQVLPVYPLSEDLQPGDVFVVQTPISKQQDRYRSKGFLPLDQLVVRLPTGAATAGGGSNGAPTVAASLRLPYDRFYREAFFKDSYGAAQVRPMKRSDAVVMPRAAFPSYNFSYEQGSGLQLAIPIQGVPIGLGLMNASRATGTVTIKDAYTYGIDIESLYRDLLTWWNSDEAIQTTLSAVARNTKGEVYLRAVNRVYLTRGVTVSLQKSASLSGGADVGAAKQISLPNLAGADADRVKASAEAYREALNALAGPLNETMPGGSVRFAQASDSAVTMDETFDRPLVVGYLGFDVRVLDGALSPPIPSFSVLDADARDFPALDGLERWIARVDERGDRAPAIYARAAALMDDDFTRSFDAARAEPEPRSEKQAFIKAKNDYLGVEDGAQASARANEINTALFKALEEE